MASRFEIEPCDCDAPYFSLSFLNNDDVTVLGKVESGGEPARFALPGLGGNFGAGEAGLFLNAALTGDRTDLVVNLDISVCIGDTW